MRLKNGKEENMSPSHAMVFLFTLVLAPWHSRRTGESAAETYFRVRWRGYGSFFFPTSILWCMDREYVTLHPFSDQLHMVELYQYCVSQ